MKPGQIAYHHGTIGVVDALSKDGLYVRFIFGKGRKIALRINKLTLKK